MENPDMSTPGNEVQNEISARPMQQGSIQNRPCNAGYGQRRGPPRGQMYQTTFQDDYQYNNVNQDYQDGYQDYQDDYGYQCQQDCYSDYDVTENQQQAMAAQVNTHVNGPRPMNRNMQMPAVQRRSMPMNMSINTPMNQMNQMNATKVNMRANMPVNGRRAQQQPREVIYKPEDDNKDIKRCREANRGQTTYTAEQVLKMEDKMTKEIGKDEDELDELETVNVQLKLPKKRRILVPPNTNISKSEYTCLGKNKDRCKYINRTNTSLYKKCTDEDLAFYRTLTISKGGNHEIDDDKEYDPRRPDVRVISDFRINSVVKTFRSFNKVGSRVSDCLLGIKSLRKLDVLCQTLEEGTEYVLAMQDYRNIVYQHSFKVVSIETEERKEGLVTMAVHKVTCADGRCMYVTVAVKRGDETVANDSYFNQLTFDTKGTYHRIMCDMYDVYSTKNSTDYRYLREIYLFKKQAGPSEKPPQQSQQQLQQPQQQKPQ